MRKIAILKMEAPENCYECILGENNLAFNTNSCQILKHEEDIKFCYAKRRRREECPLEIVPIK